MKRCFLGFVMVLFSIVYISCKKDNNNNNNNQTPLVFSELIADNDTIIGGTSTYVRATATGEGLTYQWQATAGDILGSGAVVQYAAPPCVTGANQITCTVKDSGNNTASKTITIVGI